MAGRRNPAYEAMMRRRQDAAELERQYRSGQLPRPPAPDPPEQQQAVQQPQQNPQQPPLVVNPELHVHIPQPDDRSDLERMGDNLEDAYRDENQSRVAQARDEKRMGFAKDIEAMRLDALAQRLRGYQQPDPSPEQSPMSGMFKVWNPDMQRWEDGGNRLQFGP